MQKRAAQIKRTNGFTLVEVLIAMLVLSIVAIAVAGGLIGTTKGVAFTDNRQTARNMAETQMEYVKQQPFSTDSYQMASLPSDWDWPLPTINATPLENGKIQEITVIVQYVNGYTGVAESYTLQDLKVDEK